MRLQMSAGSHIRFKKNFTKPDTECRRNFRFDIPAFPCEAFALRCKVGCHRSTSKKTFRSFPYTTLIMDSSPPIALVHCETRRGLSPRVFFLGLIYNLAVTPCARILWNTFSGSSFSIFTYLISIAKFVSSLNHILTVVLVGQFPCTFLD